MNSFDLTQYKVVTLDDIEAASKAGATELLVRDGAIFTPSARDAITAKNLSTKGVGGGSAASKAPTQWDALFHSPEAEKIKAEIVAVGKKLWQRMYVDGNGGNISCRLTPETIICTPTLVSKADLTPEDLCLVDYSGKQLAGGKPRTSEVLMHIEIYKAVPEAKSVVHCHPPHATAYAIVGRVPPTCVIPEFEVFVGRVALSPYETPGTQKFAETVIPFVKDHNCLLLSNHGIVSWADTVTHAEWYAEVLDTYCWTLMNAAQLGAPITTISPEKTSDLLAIKQRMGMPDARLDMKECQLCDLPELGTTIAVPPAAPCSSGAASGEDTEALIQAVTEAVMAALDGKAKNK
jgi:L-fuculose-phosphate aldolase